jgi:hypothetical protein
MTRTSTRMLRVLPRRQMVFSCRKRRRLACRSFGRSPISSRNSVPPSAERVRQAQRIGRRRVVIAQVFDHQLAARRRFEVARAEHAHPLHMAVTAQEGVDLDGFLLFAVVHEQTDEVVIVA